MRRRILRLLLVLALVQSMVALAAVSAVAANNDDDSRTRLEKLTFSPSGASLRGVDIQYVEVALTLSDPDGIPREQGSVADGALPCPCVLVINERVVEPRSRYFIPVTLRLVTGTDKDGVWVGRFAVGAASAGLWRVTQLHAGDLKYEDIFSSMVSTPEPWRQVTLNVRGYDWPLIWMGTRVRARPTVDVVRGGMYLTRSRRPVADTRLEIREACTTLMYPQYLKGVRTDARGRYAFTLPSTYEIFFNSACAARVAYPTDTPGAMVAVSNTRALPRIG